MNNKKLKKLMNLKTFSACFLFGVFLIVMAVIVQRFEMTLACLLYTIFFLAISLRTVHFFIKAKKCLNCGEKVTIPITCWREGQPIFVSCEKCGHRENTGYVIGVSMEA